MEKSFRGDRRPRNNQGRSSPGQEARDFSEDCRQNNQHNLPHETRRSYASKHSNTRREIRREPQRGSQSVEGSQDTAPQGARLQASKDLKFNEKVRDIVGLYMNPSEKAVVMCLDEKAAIQALDRSQTLLQLLPGMPASTSYTHKRNGTIDLFAAINILDGTVVTQFHKRHRHIEFLSSLGQ